MFPEERRFFPCPSFPKGFFKRTYVYGHKWNANLLQALCGMWRNVGTVSLWWKWQGWI
jgi:hypothetical protein